MDYLLDTNILIFMGYRPERLSPQVRELVEDCSNRLFFSAASVWEIAIKSALNKPDFAISDPALFTRRLFEADMHEMPIKSEHALGVMTLPEHFHKDPFDRLIVSQAKLSRAALITSDSQLIAAAGSFVTVIANN